MLPTGWGQPQESTLREPREVKAPSAEGNGGGPIARRAPTDCPICGDIEAEPIAVCSDFRHPAASSDAFLALRCSDCGTVYISTAAASIDRPRSKESAAAAELSGAGRQILQRAHSIDTARILTLQGDSSIEPNSLGRESLQLIVLDGTLEYIREPLTFLATLRQALRPEGQVVLILKNLESPSFAVFGGRHWAGYDVPGQRALYSVEGVRRLAGRVGLEVRAVSTVSDAGCWVESCRRALNDWQAPAWLARRFVSTSISSRAVFGVLDRMLQWRRRGGILVVALQNGHAS